MKRLVQWLRLLLPRFLASHSGGFNTRSDRSPGRGAPILGAILLLLVAGLAWNLASGPAITNEGRGSNPVQLELGDGKARWAVVLPRSSLTEVPRAQVFERLPVVVTVAVHAASQGWRAHVITLRGDVSETLRRVHTRRRVPRMNTDEPPWS